MQHRFSFKVSFITARKRSLGQGNIFRSMCQEFCPRGGGVCLSACWGAPLWDQAPPPQDRHPSGTRHTPPGPGTHPSRSRACWEIRSTSGWYASYWNAFFLFVFTDDSDDSDSDASSDDSEFRSSSSFNTTGELELSVAAVTSAALKSKKRKKNPDG